MAEYDREFRECCQNCQYWMYNKYTEENYGMGVGKCTQSGFETFCEHLGCLGYKRHPDYATS